MVPPELAMAPGKVTANAQQDVFASNWFHWDAPSKVPCAKGTVPSSPHNEAPPSAGSPASSGQALLGG